MKKYGFLYEKVYDLANIELAHINASKGKTHYSEVKMVDKNPQKHFISIQNMLKNKTYKNSPYEIITRKTDNGKIKRNIQTSLLS